jgi:hypothetical protein
VEVEGTPLVRRMDVFHVAHESGLEDGMCRGWKKKCFGCWRFAPLQVSECTGVTQCAM